MNCPCGTGKEYNECCGVYLAKESFPKTPEALMRSRYTAYARNDMSYIEERMRGPALVKFKEYYKKGAKRDIEEWIGLEVINAYSDPNPEIGYVEFIAKYKFNNTEGNIHELSKFQREEGRWFYIDGEYPTSEDPKK